MATPTEHASRETAAFLRGPAGVNTFAFGTRDDYRGGVQHIGLMSTFPAPSDNEADDFGIMAGGGFTVEIADELTDADWFLLKEELTFIVLEDGSGRLIMEY